MEKLTKFFRKSENRKKTSDGESIELDRLSPSGRRIKEEPWNFPNPEQDRSRQHKADRTQAEAQLEETLKIIGKCYNFYNEFANFIKKVERLADKPQSQVRLEEWQKLARGAKVFQDSLGLRNRLGLVNELSSLLEHDMEQLNDSIPSNSKKAFKNAIRMFTYIKNDKRHDFSVPQEKAQQIETRCRNTFRQRSQELRERYLIRVYPECGHPLANEFGGSEHFVEIKMSSYESLRLPKDAGEEAIQEALRAC